MAKLTKSAKEIRGRHQLTVRVKTSKYRDKSSNRWLERQLNDPYVAESKRLGYRSRAAFKLIQLDKNDKLQYLFACNLRDVFLVITKTGTVKLEVDDIVELTRNHAGKKIVPLPKGDLIIKCFKNK